MKQTGFIGFPDKKMQPIVVPDLFFTDLLPQIDDLAELKLTLHCFWLLNEQEGDLRYVNGADLRADTTLLDSLNLDSDLRTPVAALEDALERAVARNTLLKLEIETEIADGERVDLVVEDWYFMNTVKGRQTIALIRQGKLSELEAAIPSEARLRVDTAQHFYHVRTEHRHDDTHDRRATARYGKNVSAGLDRRGVRNCGQPQQTRVALYSGHFEAVGDGRQGRGFP